MEDLEKYIGVDQAVLLEAWKQRRKVMEEEENAKWFIVTTKLSGLNFDYKQFIYQSTQK